MKQPLSYACPYAATDKCVWSMMLHPSYCLEPNTANEGLKLTDLPTGSEVGGWMGSEGRLPS